MNTFKTEIRDGMAVDWDVPIRMDDGAVMFADVFRPIAPGKYPALVSYGPYGKGLHFEDGYKTAWDVMVKRYPDTVQGTSNLYQSWEVADPEKWVPDGYVCVRVDARGTGRSPGVVDHFSPRETQDFYECIEWAGTQDWCNGKVGLSGISYYATNQWSVAALQPPHLAAICPWEGYSDSYRECMFHGGIPSSFGKNWQEMQVKTVQYGLGERGPRSRVTGALVCGDETLSEEVLTRNRAPLVHPPLEDAYYLARRPDFSKIAVPVLSAANWGGQGLHLRGNIEGYLLSASPDKWLEVHGGEHWTSYYTDYGVQLQKKFFDRYLKGEQNGWEQREPMLLQVRHVDGFKPRAETEWPLARTQWTRLYLDLKADTLDQSVPGSTGTVSFEAQSNGLRFMSKPFESETEITGPLAARLLVSSSSSDADLYLVLGLFNPEGKEVVFHGALDPNTPIAQGWLRASHRKVDAQRSTPWRPYHPHDEVQALTPGQPVPLDIEIWPTSIVVPKGWRIGLRVRGKDYEYEGEAAKLSNMKFPMRGCGPFIHDRPAIEAPDVYAGVTTLHATAEEQPYLLIPVIPRSNGG